MDPRTRLYDAVLREAARFPVLSGCTPDNAVGEHRRLCAAFASGAEATPRWTRAAIDRQALSSVRANVDRAREDARTHGGHPIVDAYGRRLEEAARDLAVIEAAFSPNIARASLARFGASDPAADDLCRRWLSCAPSPADAELFLTDDEHDPRSLVSRMRAAISEHRVGVRVVVRDRIGALAAAGDGVVIVARGRRVPEREVRRVVLHELEGHVLPRERGRRGAFALMTLGSAGSSEDEEGRALLLEERAGAMHGDRRRTLAARHFAASLVLSGASFVELMRALHRTLELPVEERVAIASRVMRGAYSSGSETVCGVARERVYLAAYLRVGRAIEQGEITLEELGEARLSLAARRELRV